MNHSTSKRQARALPQVEATVSLSITAKLMTPLLKGVQPKPRKVMREKMVRSHFFQVATKPQKRFDETWKSYARNTLARFMALVSLAG